MDLITTVFVILTNTNSTGIITSFVKFSIKNRHLHPSPVLIIRFPPRDGASSERVILISKMKNVEATWFSSTMAMITSVFVVDGRPQRSSASRLKLPDLNFLTHLGNVRTPLALFP